MARLRPLQTISITIACLLPTILGQQIDTQLVGTWSTKSSKVLTGPGFYDPVNDTFNEPSHTGISYSFTSDGYYEEAYYRAVANPTDLSCPKSILQFQHGTISMNSDNSLSLTPFSVDGRQLQSSPCSKSGKSVYMRYNQPETFKKWQVYTDPYTKLLRLDLYKFDDSPMNPMFQAYDPPQMLPTMTMNPTASTAKATPGSKVKRWFGSEKSGDEETVLALNKDAKHIKRGVVTAFHERLTLGVIVFTGVGMIVSGLIMRKMSRRS